MTSTKRVKLQPLAHACPFCKAKPGAVCTGLSGREIRSIHIERTAAARKPPAKA